MDHIVNILISAATMGMACINLPPIFRNPSKSYISCFAFGVCFIIAIGILVNAYTGM